MPEWETVVNVDGSRVYESIIPSDYNMLGGATTVIR